MADDDLMAGRYRTLRAIGTGGMARVFLAEDERLGRQVAVKRLHAHSPEEAAQRFHREARIGASLSHQNLVVVYDVDTDGESVLIVMEYVDGVTLAEELRRGPLPEQRVVRVVRDVAAALDYVHAEGIVHRDVKPANVLLRSKDGMAKLADLGIATAAESTRITVSGTVMGTAAYMAPEQVEGTQVGPAADVYALAAVAFEALSGRKARQGDTPMAIAHEVASTPAPDLHASWPGADPGVVRVLERAMARAPEDRHHRAGELAAELEAALERSAHPAPPTAATRPVAATSTSGSRRFGKRAMAVALAAALAVVAAVVFATGGDDGSDPRPAGETQAKTAPREERPEPAETQAQAPATTPQAEAPQTTPTTPQQTQPVSGDAAKLNQQGYALLRSGDAAGAIPLLQKAVDSYPEDSKDLTYGYALFNLGSALRQAGRPAEAIPVLERRLTIPNQTKTVERELKKARKEAGKG